MPLGQGDFEPVRKVDGYLRLEDLGLVGDGATAALVGRDGSIPWLCAPRFDSPAIFCELLDQRRGGAFTITPRDLAASRQHYVKNTGVLVTEMRSGEGTLRVTDALTLRSSADLSEDVSAHRGELLRYVEALDGPVTVEVAIEPRGGGDLERRGPGFRVRCSTHPDLDLQLSSATPLEGPRTTFQLERGESAHFVLSWGAGSHRRQAMSPEGLLEQTIESWKKWVSCFDYEGPRRDLVERSAITLKLLDHADNGALVAAPTSSLPEAIGGPRNWDYRFSWVRDAAFSVYALRRIGLTQEAWWFLEWVLNAIDRSERALVLYDVDGHEAPEEVEDKELEGYRGSPPVRWGNGAADQKQNDVYGEILDCAYQWAAGGGVIDDALWNRLREHADTAARVWTEPDHGIWEVRTEGRVFTYSVAMCQVALDRAARLAERLDLPGDADAWRKEAQTIRDRIIEDAWDEDMQSLIEHVGAPGGCDASLLSLPLRRVIEPDHPKMVATCKAIQERLGAGDGLLYRYLPDESPDGLEGHEGAFVLCSFWMVDNLAKQGRVDDAVELYESLCGRANHLGLLPEQIDPSTGEFLGNFPQAFSHVGLISSAVNLGRSMER
jgi:alpha,alpha-trehalase